MVGISVDDIETQRRFKEKNQLPFPLLSDAGGEVSRRYGGTIPVLGVSYRATYVVDRDGTIQKIVTGLAAIDPSAAIAACPLPGKR